MSNPYSTLQVKFSIGFQSEIHPETRGYLPPSELVAIAMHPIRENTSSMFYALEGSSESHNRSIMLAREELASDIAKTIRHYLLNNVLNTKDTINGYTTKETTR